MLRSRKIVPGFFLDSPWERGAAEYGGVVRRGKSHDTEGSAELGLATLGIAVLYLLVLVAVAVGALLGLVRLFGEPPGEGTSTGRETFGGSRGADRLGAGGTPSLSVGPGRPEDEAV